MSVMRLHHDTNPSSPYDLRLKDYLTIHPALYRNMVLAENCRWVHNISSVNFQQLDVQ